MEPTFSVTAQLICPSASYWQLKAVLGTMGLLD